MKKRLLPLIVLLFVLPMVSAVSLTEPSFGVADSATFNVTLATTAAATCKYSGIQLPFEQMNALDETGSLTHKKIGLTLSTPETITDFFVNCSTASGYETNKFNLSFDLTNPVISSLTASPSPVADEPLETTVTLDASEKVFCKYGLTHLYGGMQAVFGEETTRTSYKTQHTLSLTNLQDNINYNYAFICKDLANRNTTTNLSLVVNTNLSSAIEWIKPGSGSYFLSRLINLSVKTNKKTTCKYGNVSADVTLQTGDFGSQRINHTAEITVAEGEQTYYIKCTFASLDTLTSSTTFVVDTTAPVLLLVNDSSPTTRPAYSPYTDKLHYAFEAKDNESDIQLYNFSIWEGSTILLNWKTTTTKSSWVENLELTNEETYTFKAKAQNKAGVWSDVVISDGVAIDTSLVCEVTCGGDCEPCPAGEACEKDSDCQSKKCVNKVCEEASCSDKIKNGNESDVDCGGSCDACAMGKKCNANADCISGLACVAGKCGLAAHCINNEKDSDEADVDCGGLECVKCANNKACEYGEDCLSERCYKDVCVEKGDIDSDGIKDQEDNCPEDKNLNQADMDADGKGDACDEDADGDGLTDSWEKTYFGAITANPDEDSDGDGLTNKQEQEKGTNPKEEDTDSDGYSDKEEIERGYDPLDERSHPVSFLKWALLVAGVIGSIAAITAIFLFFKRRTPMKTPTQVFSSSQPEPKQYYPEKHQQFLKKQKEKAEKRRALLKKFEESKAGNIFDKLRHKRQSFKK